LVNIDKFEFEDRKRIMRFVGDLYSQFKELMEDEVPTFRKQVSRASTVVGGGGPIQS
jgi:hypothetical protein